MGQIPEKVFQLTLLKLHMSQKGATSVDVLLRLPALCIRNLLRRLAAIWRFTNKWHLVPTDPQNPNAGQSRSRWHFMGTHRNQSTAMISVMSSVGSPTDVNTITMVTRPAWGMPAAPMLAAVAVILCGRKEGREGRWRAVYKRQQTTTTGRELREYYDTTEITLMDDQKVPPEARTKLVWYVTGKWGQWKKIQSLTHTQT